MPESDFTRSWGGTGKGSEMPTGRCGVREGFLEEMTAKLVSEG